MTRAHIRHLDSRPVHTRAQRDRALKLLAKGKPLGKLTLDLFNARELSALLAAELITPAAYEAETERRARWEMK